MESWGYMSAPTLNAQQLKRNFSIVPGFGLAALEW